jgi:dCMP deaminase
MTRPNWEQVIARGGKTRPSWDQVWLEVAATVAQRSLCSRAQVGAVIVSLDNRVQAASYNGPRPGFVHNEQSCTSWCPRAQPGAPITSDYSTCEATHAESSALVRADRSQLAGGTIYITSSVCINCARLIAHTELSRVVHIVNMTREAHRNPESVEEFLRESGLTVIRHAAA